MTPVGVRQFFQPRAHHGTTLMLKILGPSQGRFCDGVSRRNFLQLGALAAGGLSLPQLLQAEAQSGVRNSNKAIIMVFLPGGPSHQDMFDIKEDAPKEIRGEFKSIATKVPGVRICEHMPKLAANWDKFAAIRSLVGKADDHSSFHCMTGRSQFKPQPSGGWPSLGAVVSKMQGSAALGMPPSVGCNGKEARPGFLGASCGPFVPSGPGASDMSLNGVTSARLDDRKGLLADFDKFRRDADSSGLMDGLDTFNRQAFEVVTSSKLVEALDTKKENRKVADRYRGTDGNILRDFLLARRLVEAGVRCVTLNFGGWDTHSQNFTALKRQLPNFDIGMSALVEDLHQRGMADDVTVIAFGEFGRTPRINMGAGRDHWSRVSCALLAGGGMKTGQMIGATDRTGGEASDRPVHLGEVFSTLYNRMGIDTQTATLTDLGGRPQYLVDLQHHPIRELI